MSSCNGLPILIIMALFSILFNTTKASTCSLDFTAMAKKNMGNCQKLTTLGAEFGWNYNKINKSSQQIDIFFGAKVEPETRWVAWGLNPSGRPHMVGTRALISIREPNGSHITKTYNITDETKRGFSPLRPSEIEMEVHNFTSEFKSNCTNYFTISATLVLSLPYNITRLHHVWQVGYYAEGDQPQMHLARLQNIDSTGTINLETGSVRGVGQHIHHMRMVHGILNIVGWGTLMPIGVIIARYFRKFPVQLSWWFKLHVSCQFVGYLLGTAGWIIGLWLGHSSKFYTFHTHRILAMFVFAFTTLQMLALRLKPVKNDEYRKYWNMYHHFLGYALIAVISTNIFQGISILKPDSIVWKRAFIGVLGLLAFTVAALEIFTWGKFLKKKKKSAVTEPVKNASPTPHLMSDQIIESESSTEIMGSQSQDLSDISTVIN